MAQVSPRPGRAARLCSSARWRSADTRPNWSRAGGRSPSTRRRTSAISSRACSDSCPTRSAACVGFSGIRSRAASSRIAIAASDGPSPSCRSRRTRRRSSSRAAIRCCRDSWSSRLMETAWARAPTWLPTSSSSRRSPGPNGSRPASTSSRSRPTSAPPTCSSMVVGRPRGSPIEVAIRFEGGSPKTSIAAYERRNRRASRRSVSWSASVGAVSGSASAARTRRGSGTPGRRTRGAGRSAAARPPAGAAAGR